MESQLFKDLYYIIEHSIYLWRIGLSGRIVGNKKEETSQDMKHGLCDMVCHLVLRGLQLVIPSSQIRHSYKFAGSPMTFNLNVLLP